MESFLIGWLALLHTEEYTSQPQNLKAAMSVPEQAKATNKMVKHAFS